MLARVLGTIVATVLAATGVTSPIASDRINPFGAPGVGDAYYPGYGNGGYDVRHYGIRIDYNPVTERLVGDTVVRARATQWLARFTLDLRLNASGVSVDGRRATFRQHGRELVVTPRSALRKGEQFRVRVTYQGNPGAIKSDGLGGWFETSDGAVVAGEPEAATLWFPSNDHPTDKARFDIRVVTAAGTDAVSNGRLIGKRTEGSQTVWHWRETSPMATYLAYAAIGDFTFVRGRTRGGVPYLYAISEHLGEFRRPAVRSLRKSADVVDFFSQAFGSYPFAITGGTVVNGRLGFALENQTRPVYPEDFFRHYNPGVIAHELAHQWFGDDVSVRRWRHIWLNEGFAVWSSWLYAGHRQGQPANRQFASNYRALKGWPEFWRTRVGDPGPDDLFASAVYVRGAMALQALRNKIGQRDFSRLLRSWVRAHGGETATIRQFHARAERISGRSLDRLFRVWLHDRQRPEVSKRNGFPSFMLDS